MLAHSNLHLAHRGSPHPSRTSERAWRPAPSRHIDDKRGHLKGVSMLEFLLSALKLILWDGRAPIWPNAGLATSGLQHQNSHIQNSDISCEIPEAREPAFERMFGRSFRSRLNGVRCLSSALRADPPDRQPRRRHSTSRRFGLAGATPCPRRRRSPCEGASRPPGPPCRTSPSSPTSTSCARGGGVTSLGGGDTNRRNKATEAVSARRRRPAM